MISAIIWNIRGLKSRGDFERLKFLSNMHKLHFIAIQQPFVDSPHIVSYKRFLLLSHVMLTVVAKSDIFGESTLLPVFYVNMINKLLFK